MKREYTLEEQMKIIKKGGRACANEIDKISNPIEKLQIKAIKQDGEVIRYIENPSFEMICLAADNLESVDSVIINLQKHVGKYRFFSKDIKRIISKEDYKIFNTIENKETYIPTEEYLKNKEAFISTIEPLKDFQKGELKDLIEEMRVAKTRIFFGFEDTGLCCCRKDDYDDDDVEDDVDEDGDDDNDE